MGAFSPKPRRQGTARRPGLGWPGGGVEEPLRRTPGSWPGSRARWAFRLAASTLARRRVGLEGRGGGALLAGTVTLYLSLLVVLPLTAVVWRSGRDGWGAFWAAATQPQALAALRLTFTVALVVAAVNAVMGTV